ncbi:hypothetical protein Scep_014402 [Stephania cephalantha]|uniref:Uncharacterized protein n=1 Tax=Stephania cephalantha TaxID=152367 RepID=A0AAP0J156_9MAGN
MDIRDLGCYSRVSVRISRRERDVLEVSKPARDLYNTFIVLILLFIALILLFIALISILESAFA